MALPICLAGTLGFVSRHQGFQALGILDVAVNVVVQSSLAAAGEADDDVDAVRIDLGHLLEA